MGVLLMDELSSSFCGRLFAIIVRPKEEGAEDNPLIVVGVHTKDIALIDTPACRPLPGPKELTLVEPLTRL